MKDSSIRVVRGSVAIAIVGILTTSVAGGVAAAGSSTPACKWLTRGEIKEGTGSAAGKGHSLFPTSDDPLTPCIWTLRGQDQGTIVLEWWAPAPGAIQLAKRAARKSQDIDDLGDDAAFTIDSVGYPSVYVVTDDIGLHVWWGEHLNVDRKAERAALTDLAEKALERVDRSDLDLKDR